MQAPKDANNLSLIRPLGYRAKNSCGYCKNQTGSSSYSLTSDNLRIDHYQDLVDRGWRRSGTHYYKPDLPRACCPHYTIRLDAGAFRPKKGQRKVVNRWNHYILGAEYIRKAARLCPISRDEKREKRRGKFDLVSAIHASEYSNIKRPVDPATKVPIEPAHKFEVTFEPDQFSTSKWHIFVPYQTTVHKEPKSHWSHHSFKRFLCSGLGQKSITTNGESQRLGSYHQCYKLDGKLIAVGVLDLLPHGVSAVYFFYDPEFEEWELGKLSALREIALAWEGHYQYYYMGFYIHSCVKMRYKGAYSPSYILDPESLEWNPLDAEFRKKLDLHPYVSLSRERALADRKTAANSRNGSAENTTMGQEAADERDAEEVELSRDISPPNNGFNESQLELDSDPSDDETETYPTSLFRYNIPGVMKKEEVEQLDLDHWKMLVKNNLVELEDFVSWEEGHATNPGTLKGVASEVAAAIGPNVVSGSAIILF